MADIPNDSTTTTEISVGGTLIDSLEVVGDHDWISIELVAGETVTITLAGTGDTPVSDPYLRLRDPTGAEIARNDDIDFPGGNLNSQLTFTATVSGTYYIDAGAYSDYYSGNYQLSVSQHTTDGTAGDDVLIGTSVNETINGLGGNDYLAGAGNNDELNGGDGNDKLDGGDGDDALNGGAGRDGAVYTFASSAVTVDLTLTTAQNTGGAGIDTLSSIEDVSGSEFTDTITGNALNNVLSGRGGDDTLNGGDGADRLRGATGADTLNGGEGADILDGGLGDDSMAGGIGNDTYLVDSYGDIVTEAADGGIDLIRSSLDYRLGDDVERLTLTGTAEFGIGNELNNRITGNAGVNYLHGEGGKDILSGGGGDDRLFGGLGKDRLAGGAGADDFVFETELNAITNVDRILDFSVADDAIHLSATVFSAIGSGELAAAAFHQGTAAADADDRIIYDSATGRIYYDADGSGDGAAVLFAQVNAGTALTNADFFVG